MAFSPDSACIEPGLGIHTSRDSVGWRALHCGNCSSESYVDVPLKWGQDTEGEVKTQVQSYPEGPALYPAKFQAKLHYREMDFLMPQTLQKPDVYYSPFACQHT